MPDGVHALGHSWALRVIQRLVEIHVILSLLRSYIFVIKGESEQNYVGLLNFFIEVAFWEAIVFRMIRAVWSISFKDNEVVSELFPIIDFIVVDTKGL